MFILFVKFFRRYVYSRGYVYSGLKSKRKGITEILRRIWLFSANKIKSSEYVSKQPTQLIVELILSLRHIIVTLHHLLLKHWVFLVKKRKRKKEK